MQTVIIGYEASLRPGTSKVVSASSGTESLEPSGSGGRIVAGSSEVERQNHATESLAEAVRRFELPEQELMDNLNSFKPPQEWYDRDEDLFGD